MMVKVNIIAVGVELMKMKFKRLSIAVGLLLAAALILGACAGLGNSEAEGPGGDPVSGEEQDQDTLVELVKADLASWKGVSIEDIGAASIEAVEWPDASLGCPKEGEMAAQVITPGYRILLAIGGPASIEQFDYRTDTLGNFVLCEG
jgi:hypothetical protein